MQKIGIICAADTELEPFLALIDPKETYEKAMLRFHKGSIGQMEVIAVYSGVCKVNAAIAAQVMIDCFQVEAIINGGTAGGMDASVQLFDTVISEVMCYHDVEEEVLTQFHPWLDTIWFPAGDGLLSAAKEYAKTIDAPVRFGRMATGEQFIADEKRDEINAQFVPLSVDMETTAIAQVCHANDVPFLAVRSVTDTADHRGNENFEKNCARASGLSAEITVGFLRWFQQAGFANM